MVIHQLQVERRTAKAHRPKTNALPLDHATNQLSLLPSAEREVSDGQSAVTLCGWEVRQVWLFPFVDARAWRQVKLCDHSLIRAIAEHLTCEVLSIRRCTYVPFTYLLIIFRLAHCESFYLYTDNHSTNCTHCKFVSFNFVLCIVCLTFSVNRLFSSCINIKVNYNCICRVAVQSVYYGVLNFWGCCRLFCVSSFVNFASILYSRHRNFYYTVSQKTSHLWFAITLTYVNAFLYFWHKCYRWRKQSKDDLLCHPK